MSSSLTATTSSSCSRHRSVGGRAQKSGLAAGRGRPTKGQKTPENPARGRGTCYQCRQGAKEGHGHWNETGREFCKARSNISQIASLMTAGQWHYIVHFNAFYITSFEWNVSRYCFVFFLDTKNSHMGKGSFILPTQQEPITLLKPHKHQQSHTNTYNTLKMALEVLKGCGRCSARMAAPHPVHKSNKLGEIAEWNTARNKYAVY